MRRANEVQYIIPPCPRLRRKYRQNRAQDVSLRWDYAPSFPTVKVKLSCDLDMTTAVDLQPEALGLCGCQLLRLVTLRIVSVLLWCCLAILKLKAFGKQTRRQLIPM